MRPDASEPLATVARGLGVSPSGLSASFFVPGRIEVLGKHTDYAGGRSLLCAVQQGFTIAVRARPDRHVHLFDLAGSREASFPLSGDLEPPIGLWTNYPMTVARRLARNFPAARTGADIAFISDLPVAAGLSSSSAFIIATFLALAAVNRLVEDGSYRAEIGGPEDLGAYLATVENGQSFGRLAGDMGVGTFGGSEDHTAILCCRQGELAQYSFMPVRFERSVTVPLSSSFIVADSGVVAEKTGLARDAYNQASLAAKAALDQWNSLARRHDTSLAQAASASTDAVDRIRAALASQDHPRFSSGALVARFEQFREESLEIVPAASAALSAGDLETFGRLVDRSQRGAERWLGNQVPETIALQRLAREHGAAAASAFGAGFGGSVWAMVGGSENDREPFLAAWRSAYLDRFPARARNARFFTTRPGPAARSLTAPSALLPR